MNLKKRRKRKKRKKKRNLKKTRKRKKIRLMKRTAQSISKEVKGLLFRFIRHGLLLQV